MKESAELSLVYRKRSHYSFIFKIKHINMKIIKNFILQPLRTLISCIMIYRLLTDTDYQLESAPEPNDEMEKYMDVLGIGKYVISVILYLVFIGAILK